jgi:hypothetical protein
MRAYFTISTRAGRPDMPIFLKPGIYVRAPLEATYQAT